jgi:hypothetical protein
MNREVNREPYEFCNEYKALSERNRKNLIKIARTLLNQQKEDKELLSDTAVVTANDEIKDTQRCQAPVFP